MILMERTYQIFSRNKAASAALAALLLVPVSSISTHAQEWTIPADIHDTLFPENTIPPLPEEKEAYEKIKKAYYFQEPQTLDMLLRFIHQYPTSAYAAECRLLIANWYFFSKEYPLALKYYSDISENAFSGNTREEMLYRKAYAELKTGFYDESKILFGLLRNSKTYGDSALFYMAYIDYVNGRYNEAYDQFKKIQSGSKYNEAEYYINQIDYRNGEYRKVANTSERLLSGGKTIPDELKGETLRVGGLSYFKLGDKLTAEKLLSQYMEQAGNGAEIGALYALASIYYDQGEYMKALPLFTVVTEYPGELSQSSWLYIGQIYLEQGDANAATLAFDKAANKSWNPMVAETAAYNLAVTSASGMGLPFSDAAAAMESFIDTYPRSPYSPLLSSYLANAYYGRRDYENALRHLDKMANPDESSKEMRQKILYHLGVEDLKQGRTDLAIKRLSEASATSFPNKEVATQAALWLGDAFYTKNNFSEASKAYEKAISTGLLGENVALAQYNLGYSLLKQKKYSQAAKAFEKALALEKLSSTQTTDARLRYADCLYYTGHYSEALSIFRDVKLEGGPEAVFAQIREADILGRNGKVEEKILILEKLIDNPNASIWNSVVLSRLADAYSEQGNDRKAAELYSRILEESDRDSDNSQTYYSLAANAENLYKAGDYKAAYDVYKHLEKSGMSSFYPMAVTGIMQTSSDNSEIAEYAAKVAALPGLSPEERNEALLLGAEAALTLGGQRKQNAISTLYTLARSSDRNSGARAAVDLGEELLKQGDYSAAEDILLYLVDTGSDDNYWLARGYIALADVYIAQDKDYLAKLYLETLRNNYPGTEKDINRMITSRLKTLSK